MTAPSIGPRWGNVARNAKAEAIHLTLRCAVPGLSGGRWLDVGCGSGGIAATLSGQVREIVGVDPEPWEEWGGLCAKCPNLTFVIGECDRGALPVNSESFDVVVCNQVYEHVASPSTLIANIARVLRPGGTCYFAGPNLLWPVEPHVFLPFVHWLPRSWIHGLLKFLGSRRADQLDAFSASYWQLTRWFGDAGLTWRGAVGERLMAGMGFGDYIDESTPVATVLRVLGKLLHPVAPGFVFILRKPLRGA